MSKPIIVIVGAGPGVSTGLARRFGREGFQVALIARNAAKLDGYVAEMKQADLEARSYEADAGDPTSLTAAFDRIKADLGDPSVLAYNAAAFVGGVPSSLSVADLQSSFAVNVAGALVAAQQVIPAMRSAQAGTILFTGGGLALYPWSGASALAIGKAGIRSLAYTLGEELEPAGIHVATVTIAGTVQPDTHFDPDRIADTYWHLHTQPAGQWEREIVYK